jgi:hypothetical protein
VRDHPGTATGVGEVIYLGDPAGIQRVAAEPVDSASQA